MKMKVMLDEGAFMPVRAHDADAGLDLKCRESVTVYPALRESATVYPALREVHIKIDAETGAYTFPELFPVECSAAIDTGVHVEIPAGYYGKIETKSGLNRKHHILCTGVVDEGYTGSIVVIVYNLGSNPYEFKAGDKIAQLVIQPCIKPELEQVTEFTQTERGDNGFGSTGR